MVSKNRKSALSLTKSHYSHISPVAVQARAVITQLPHADYQDEERTH